MATLAVGTPAGVDAQRAKIRAAVESDAHGPGVLVYEDASAMFDEVLADQRQAIETLLTEERP